MPPRIPTPFNSVLRRRYASVLRPPPRRSLIAAPKPGDGPLMSRRSDRALPTIRSPFRWLRTIPLFLFIVGGSAAAIFNYQKSSSSVVESTLYALRTSADARRALGDEIYFASRIPWIRGEINQLHGRIDVSFWVKGTRGKGKMRFRSLRRSRMGYVSLNPRGAGLFGDVDSLTLSYAV